MTRLRMDCENRIELQIWMTFAAVDEMKSGSELETETAMVVGTLFEIEEGLG
jgi:hypothetical protein